MAEVYVIGEICCAENFREPNLFVRWNFQTGLCSSKLVKWDFWQFSILGSLWKFVEGEFEGQTSTDSNELDNKSVFAHPIDLHLATRGIQGWPKLSVEVFSVNALKQFYPVGVGFAFLPTSPGTHKIEIATWRVAPLTAFDVVKEKFFTGGFTIIKKDLIHSGIERYKISTLSSGTVTVELSLVFKNFNKYNIKFEGTPWSFNLCFSAYWLYRSSVAKSMEQQTLQLQPFRQLWLRLKLRLRFRLPQRQRSYRRLHPLLKSTSQLR